MRQFGYILRGNGAHLNVEGHYVVQRSEKTICTTNTAWSGTRKMTAALVDNLGSEAPGGKRTFPTPAAMAAADEQFYKDVIRAGYRGPYLKALATDVAEGTLDTDPTPTFARSPHACSSSPESARMQRRT